jgi:predicted ATPase
VYAKAGEIGAGLQALQEAEALVAQTRERYWEAELYRLRAELLIAQGRSCHAHQDAEMSLRHALAVARQQWAKTLELRVSICLSRLWQRQGRREEAWQLLAPVYGWFTEGVDSADLQEAKALLDELAS